MKTITSVIILIFSFSFLKAQTNAATPNANFEHWTHSSNGYDDANGWNDLNPDTYLFGIVTCYKDSTIKKSGNYSAELVTLYSSTLSETIPGALTTGTYNIVSKTISGGLPYTLRPDSIIGWYQYGSKNGDNGDCEFYLFGSSNTDTIGQAFFRTPASNVSTWTRFSLAITYTSSATPATALWIFSSSTNQAGAQIGSALYIDSIGLVFDSTLGIKNIKTASTISVGPNPTTGLISVTNSSNSNSAVFSIYDVTGRKLEEEKITTGTSYINIAAMPEGLYIYSIRDEQNAILKTGKIVVQK
jgi:hypothetical protein